MCKHRAHLVLVDLKNYTHRFVRAGAGNDLPGHIFGTATLGGRDRRHTATFELRKIRAVDDLYELEPGDVDISGVEVLLERT